MYQTALLNHFSSVQDSILLWASAQEENKGSAAKTRWISTCPVWGWLQGRPQDHDLLHPAVSLQSRGDSSQHAGKHTSWYRFTSLISVNLPFFKSVKMWGNLSCRWASWTNPSERCWTRVLSRLSSIRRCPSSGGGWTSWSAYRSSSWRRWPRPRPSRSPPLSRTSDNQWPLFQIFAKKEKRVSVTRTRPWRSEGGALQAGLPARASAKPDTQGDNARGLCWRGSSAQEVMGHLGEDASRLNRFPNIQGAQGVSASQSENTTCLIQVNWLSMQKESSSAVTSEVFSILCFWWLACVNLVRESKWINGTNAA